MNSFPKKKFSEKLLFSVNAFARYVFPQAIFFSCAAFLLFYPLPAHALSFSDIFSALGQFGSFILDEVVIGPALEAVSSLIFGIAESLLWATTGIFDFAIQFSLNISSFKIGAISAGWGVLRDTANIAFIAVLIYIAFLTILQAGGANTKSLLVNLIIMALLINFSFFLAGVVIDASNIIASIFYNKMALNPDGSTRSISGIFSEGLKLASIVDAQTLIKMTPGQIAVSKLFGAVMLFIAAFTFLSGAILFVSRTVVLLFILVLSPLAFAAMILPATKKYWDEWLHNLLNYSFVAPTYLLLIYVVSLIVQGKELITLTETTRTVATPFASTYSYAEVGKVFFQYIIYIGLLLGAYTIAKTMASGIAGLSVKWAGKATGAAFGLAAIAGRRGLGRGFGALARSEWLKNLGFKFEKDAEGNIISTKAKSGFGGFLARKALGGAEGVAKSSFDVRAGKIGGALGATEVGFGTAGGRGGFEATRKRQIDRELAMAKSFGETTFSRKEYEEVGRLKPLVEVEKKNVAEAEKATTEAKAKEAAIVQKLEQLPKDIEIQTEKRDEARRIGDKTREAAIVQKLEKLNQSVLDENKNLDAAVKTRSAAEEKEAAALQKLAGSQRNLNALEGRGKARAGAYAEKVGEERFFPLMDPKTKREVANKIKAELGKSPELKLQEELAATLKQLAEKQ